MAASDRRPAANGHRKRRGKARGGRRPPRTPRSFEPSRESRVGVAYVRRAWGTDGSIAVSRFTDDQEQFDAGAVVYLHDGRWGRVERSHISGDAVVVKLDAVQTPEQADELRDTVLEMEDSDIPPLPEGEFYHYQVIGCAVQTAHGEDLGTVKEIIATGANDVFVVQAEGGEVLVPAIGGVVEAIDVDGRVITVDLPEGLR